MLNKLNYLEFGKNTGFEANKDYTLNFDLNAMGGLDNLLTYPLSLHLIKFTPVKSNFGEHVIQLKSLRAHYPIATALPGDVNGDGDVTSADVTALYSYLLNNDTSSLVNGDQDGDGFITSSDVTTVYTIILGN